MQASSADATFYGVMVGMGETFLPAFALAIGLGEVNSGLVASVPMMVGGFLQIASIRVLAWGVSEKTWVVASATIQALAFIPLMIAAWLGNISPWVMLLIASVYWAGGLAAGPAWNIWIEQMIPRSVRANYFSRRTRATQIATLISFIAAGLLLQTAKDNQWVGPAFAILFAGAFVARLISVALLAKHRLPSSSSKHSQLLPSPEVMGDRSPEQIISGKHLLIYLVLVQGMVQLSGPYFTPYMLQHLELSYLEFTGLVAVAFVAKIISLALWGELARQRGASWLLTLGGTAIVPLTLLWTVSQNYYWLVLIQVINGVAWAAYELGFFLMFFESIPARSRIKMLTYYNVANTTAWCAGSSLGALILTSLGATVSTYYLLFSLSALGRLGAMGYLYFHRPTIKVRVTQIGLRVLGLRPNGSSLDSPILPSIPDPQTERSTAA